MDVIKQFRMLIEAHIKATTTYEFPVKLYPTGMYAVEGQWRGAMVIKRAGEDSLVLIDGAYRINAPVKDVPSIVWVVASIATIYTAKGQRATTVANHEHNEMMRIMTKGNMVEFPPTLMKLSNEAERVILGLMSAQEWENHGWSEGDQREMAWDVWRRSGQ